MDIFHGGCLESATFGSFERICIEDHTISVSDIALNFGTDKDLPQITVSPCVSSALSELQIGKSLTPRASSAHPRP